MVSGPGKGKTGVGKEKMTWSAQADHDKGAFWASLFEGRLGNSDTFVFLSGSTLNLFLPKRQR